MGILNLLLYSGTLLRHGSEVRIYPALRHFREGTRSLEVLEVEAAGLEADYVSSLTPDRYRVWQRSLRQLSLLRVENTKMALFYSQQKVFEHGGKNGRLLAWLAKSQNPTTHIASIRDVDGHLLVSPDLINQWFLQFFRGLYESRAEYSANELTAFLYLVKFPMLDKEDRERLEVDISLEE